MLTETQSNLSLRTLDTLLPEQEAIITHVGGEGALRQHFLDMGIIMGAKIRFVKSAPLGDPLEFVIHGYNLTLRQEDAQKITIELYDKKQDSHTSAFKPQDIKLVDRHPGIGEEMYVKPRKKGNKLSNDEKLVLALAGNQNCGKTTLFNQLTGSNQRVGNFPGVTVDRKEGSVRGRKNVDVVDLPGIYSMSPYSKEEVVSREFILNEKPSCIINIIDVTNIERNMYLTIQLMELDVPMVIALNMMDELQNNKGIIHINELESILGVPVVPISAINNEGVSELIDHALRVARNGLHPGRLDFCNPEGKQEAIHRCLHSIMHLIEGHAKNTNMPVRFAATKIAEGEEGMLKTLRLSDNEEHAIEHIVKEMEGSRGIDRAAAIADMRFSFIGDVVSRTVEKPTDMTEQKRSNVIDRVLTGRFTAIPVFILIMIVMFYLTFDLIGGNLQSLIGQGVAFFSEFVKDTMINADISNAVVSFVIDGVISGVGVVLTFFPIIVLMFLFLSFLQDTGYMARVAFFMDRALRRIGLSGRSIVPLIMGFGCSVPAVMATRTLPSERDRKVTILLTPFMSCLTKLMIYGFIAEVFFPEYAALVVICLYLLGILVGLVIGIVTNRIFLKGEAVPFVMELPNYRMPSLRSTLQLMWDKSKDFITRAFSVIVIATIIVWFLQSFSFSLDFVEEPDNSILAHIAGMISPLFAPLGFDDWRFVVALISGFMAKELVVSTITVSFSTFAALAAALSPAAAISFLVFCLLYTPCVAAIAAIKRELNGKWAFGIVLIQCGVAWIVSFAAFHIAHMCGLG